MGVKATSQVTITDITDAYSVTLTSESYTFVGDSTGAPSGLNCTTQVVAYCGVQLCSNVKIGDIVCPTGISATITDNETNSPTIIFTTTNIISDSCEAVIPVEVNEVVINKKFIFSVAKSGDPGTDGKTTYLHIKYSDDGLTFTSNNGNDVGAWIGTLTDYNEEASNVFSDYTWKKFTDDVDDELEEIHQSITTVEQTANGLKTQVDRNSEEISTIKQTASEIDIRLQKVIDDGTTKLSTEFGLTIDGSCVDIHRSGEEMHNSLDETGMYVRRGEEVILQANNEGVVATDVTVRNYLIVGDHARFENYSNGTDTERTACFWI